ncbi:unnamed protein product [Mytilus edulis]|uniref:Uncharacterized protein n=1 Tax=Mytilus edulis TaxID=6550 RepID=A0A8S3S463_MYTED|nr:unnamed protein product [Mytilus edulis]
MARRFNRNAKKQKFRFYNKKERNKYNMQQRTAHAKKHVINLSKRRLSNQEYILLAKGLKFIPTPSSKNAKMSILKDYNEFARKLRCRYMFSQEKTDLHPFRSNTGYKPASTCHTLDYITEVTRQLNTQHYCQLDSFNMAELKIQVIEYIKSLYDQGIIDKISFKFLTNGQKLRDARLGRIYILPKIHRLETETFKQIQHDGLNELNIIPPGRPIISQCGSVTELGNGKVSVSLDSEKGMYIRLNRALSLTVKYYPIVTEHLDDYSSKDATVLNIHHVIADKIQCFEVKNSVVVNLDQIGQTQLKDAKVSKASTTDATGMSVEYTSTQGVILIPDSKYKVHIAIATVKIGPSVAIKAGKSVRFHVVTAVNYTQAVDLKSKAPEHLQRSVDQLLESVMKIDYASLREEHIKVWRDIWKSEFGISNSKAAGSLNGDKINTTIYYVLSNIQAPLHELSTTVEEKSKIQKTLHYPDRCYGGHTLLFYSETLWSEIKDEEDIADVTSTWMITLEKKGCNIIVRAGAEGVLQAILLSLGGLRNDRPYYACDAGCIDAPIALSKEVVQFPVKRTEPLTSILYITADKQHMEELKHTIHVKEIKEAPAHEHHVIALHKHGHHFGGLPTIFWASLAFLIIIFHLFLFKLIYNEYCQGQDRYGRTRYSV